ncbi:SusC/RagA family TonB-linked outer membrane protein [Parasegetibacter sp. NRK P23]|uniref:SusC/RagA family TonB-linked outer membrane protein n=1 Tax=Parasegetibacter sp. NRK P23 TaxID=2942999 RepID=UPI0020442F13|nr:SusC/RagA family TonB-linked outer membrane protein [Parasegetibacter sp. NRK P23]MCM5529510.1 SusC/RagA family TonB-linked outer membrane protein [Parasegetibacter sp. NRK P23]
MRKLVLLLLGVLFLCGQLLAQNRTITGKVIDEQGNPISNVSVIIKGTSTGTSTSSDGAYSISVAPGARFLVFSAVGFAETEVSIGDRSVVNASLRLEDKDLTEVVVVGYSNTTKEAFTGSAKVVSGELLNNKAVSNISQSLAGEVAGVRVINTTGQPGASATVRIRGFGSVNGNRAPLYVIDGVPYSGNLNAINMADVESTTVLKDAAATAIYGARGANGVIIITTRTGKSKRPFIEVDGRIGTNFSALPRYNKLTSPEQYIGLAWESMYNFGVIDGAADPTAYANTNLFSANGIDPKYNLWNVANGGELIDPTTRTVRPGVTRKYDPENWEDYGFQSSTRQEVNLKLGGGDAKSNYYTSLGYLNDVGYSINSDFKRLSARLNINQEVKRWLTASMNIGYANTETNNNGQESNSNSIFWFVDNLPPIYPLFLRDANGNFVPDPIFGGNQFDYGEDRGFGGLTNAIADATLNTLRAKRNELNGNSSLNFKFTDYLSFETRLGVQYYNNAYVNLTNKFYGSAASQNGSVFQTKTELLNTNFLQMLRFNKEFGSHGIEALVAHEATDWRQSIASASRYNLVSNDIPELNNGVVSNPSTSYSNAFKLESYFAQINYDKDNTYYLSATARRDGSSRFVKDKWGNFGSIGAGWVISNNAFMDKFTIIDFLKLKASYGLIGEQEGIGFYPGYDRFNVDNLNDNPAFSFDSKGNPDLTWETSQMFQAGLEFRLGQFLTGSVDYYVKNTKDLIFDRRVGPSIGYALIKVNDGVLRNQGLEFDLTGHIIKKKDTYIDLNINGETFKNKIIEMPIDPSTGEQKVIDVQAPFGWAKGKSIYDFYMRDFAGVDPADGTSTWVLYYDDLNNNDIADAGEGIANMATFLAANPSKESSLKQTTTKAYSSATQYYVGKSAIPKLRGAANLRAGWKNFNLAVQMLYSFGGYANDGAYASLMDNGIIGTNNWHADMFNRWQKAGDITDVPRLSNSEDQNVISTSTRFLTKSNFLALNNIRLGYDLPAALMARLGVGSASFWVSGDNLWIHSARKGFNPSTSESGASSIYNYAPLTTVTVGLKVRL